MSNNNKQPRYSLAGITDEQFGELCEEKLAEQKLQRALIASKGQPVPLASIRGVNPQRPKPSFVPRPYIPYEEEELDNGANGGKSDTKSNNK